MIIKKLLLTLFTFSLAFAAQAADYPSGHGALQLFDEAAMEVTPRWVQIWMQIMGLSFAVGLIFVWRHVAARWVVGGFITGVIFMLIATKLGALPLSGFIALIHLIFWSPALCHLLTKLPFMAEKITPFSVWAGWITAVIIFSFIFDIRDAAIYLNHII